MQFYHSHLCPQMRETRSETNETLISFGWFSTSSCRMTRRSPIRSDIARWAAFGMLGLVVLDLGTQKPPLSTELPAYWPCAGFG